MEFRFSTVIKALLMFACILGGCEYLSQLDKLKAELAELKAQAGPLRETKDLRRQEWSELKAAKDKQDQLMRHEAELLKKRDLLDTQERKLTGQIKYLAASMTAAVEKARSMAIGTVFPELNLPGHPTLHNAKIFKINDDSISFLHEDGAANLHIKAEELPVELVQKYDLGLKSIHKALQRLRAELEVPGPAK